MKMREVERAFSKAIIRRDMICKIRDYTPCSGSLECSHFYTRGSSPALKFYPFNAFAQCKNHHWRHHNVLGNDFYNDWINERYADENEYMKAHRMSYIKYTEDVLKNIYSFCIEDNLNGLRDYLRGLI